MLRWKQIYKVNKCYITTDFSDTLIVDAWIIVVHKKNSVQKRKNVWKKFRAHIAYFKDDI